MDATMEDWEQTLRNYHLEPGWYYCFVHKYKRHLISAYKKEEVAISRWKYLHRLNGWEKEMISIVLKYVNFEGIGGALNA